MLSTTAGIIVTADISPFLCEITVWCTSDTIAGTILDKNMEGSLT